MYLYKDERDSGTYYKIRETYRDDDGKIHVRNVKYLGTAEAILEAVTTPSLDDLRFNTVAFGPAAALRWAFDELQLAELFTELFDPDETHEFPAWKKCFLLVWRRFCQDLSINDAVEIYADEIFPFWWSESPPTAQRLYQFIGEALDPETIREAQTAIARRATGDGTVTECHLDTTNYATYVSDDTTYLRIGKSKQGVVGRRLVGLALAVTEDALPVLSEVYPGNNQDVTLFPGLFERVCTRLEAAGVDLKGVTMVFDRGFDDTGNYDLAASKKPHAVAAVKRNRTVVREVLEAADLSSFQQAYETTYGTCYVTDAGSIDIGDHTWRLVLSYHDSTREKIQQEMDTQHEEAEEVLSSQVDRLDGGGRGRPPTENSIRKKLDRVLGDNLAHLDWAFDPETNTLDWAWEDGWSRKYRYAGVQPLITDHSDWTPGRVARTYFDQQDLEDTFHLTKEALIVPVSPSYVKVDHLVVGHLFTIFVGLVCYTKIRHALPDSLSDPTIKRSLQALDMVIAVEDETPTFKLANVDERTRPAIDAMDLEGYLPT